MTSSSIEPLSGFLLTTTAFSLDQLIDWGILVLLLLCSALISGSEVAFFSLAPADLNQLEETKEKSSERILLLLEKPKKLLATILIVNNFVNVGIIILISYLAVPILSLIANDGVRYAVEIGGITFIVLLLGEVIPKVYANKHAIRLARTMANPLLRLRWLFGWLSWLLIGSTNIVDKRLGRKEKGHTVEELETALELTRDQNTSEEEHKLLEGIVRFGNTDVRQVMKPRTDVIAFDHDDAFNAITESIIDSGFSRIPVYKGSFDKIVGLLYIKDLLPHLDKEKDFEWQSLIRAPFFVPESKKIDDLFKEFQEKKIHLAIVVDEYGGTSGIVTLEDVIEEILGEISDEFDDDDLAYSKIDDCNYVFEAKTPLNDFYRVLNINLSSFDEAKGESETLGGFILELSGKIPMKNEKIHFKNYTFTIETADRRKVKQIKVTIHKTESSKAT